MASCGTKMTIYLQKVKQNVQVTKRWLYTLLFCYNDMITLNTWYDFIMTILENVLVT